jgi:filamentous hemagglutinin
MQALAKSTEFTDKLTFNLVNAGGRALTNVALNGGSLEDALKDALRGAVVDTVYGKVASQIKGLESEYIAHKLAHALAGCVAGAAAGGQCKDGAIGAAVGEIVAGMFPRPTGPQTAEQAKAYNDKVLAYSKIVAGGVTAFAGGNIQTALNTAEISVVNNYLSKPQLVALQSELNSCKQTQCSEAQTNAILDRYLQQSKANDAALAACTTTACVDTHRATLLEAAQLSASVMWQVSDSRGSLSRVNELTLRENKGSTVQYLYSRAQHIEQARKQLDQYVTTNCQGLSQAACSTKLQSSQATGAAIVEIFVGFTPAGIAVDIKDLLQAKTMGDFSLAVLGTVLPVIGDGVKALVRAQDAARAMENLRHIPAPIERINIDGIKEVDISATPLERQRALNTPDTAAGGRLQPAEAAAAAQLEPTLGSMQRYSGTSSGSATPDFEIVTGPNKGKTVELMYTTTDLSPERINGLNMFYEKSMTFIKTGEDRPYGQKQILDHLNKADLVVVDFRVLNLNNQAVFTNFVRTLSVDQRAKIIILR